MTPPYPAFTDTFPGLLAALPKDRQIVVIGHARPDGDCIGSQVALVRVCRALGYDAVCLNPDPVPRRLEFCVGDTPFLAFADVAPDAVAVYVDCADSGRAGARIAERFSAPVGVIDHHISNLGYATHNLVDAASCATAEILTGLFLRHALPIDVITAKALYVGIATDTGQFRFRATTARTFAYASELVRLGAEPDEAGNELYERESFGKIQLLQHFLASLRTECDGRICLGILPEGIYEQTGTGVEDTEGLVDYARSIEGVDIGVLIEIRQGAIKGSLRAKRPDFRVDQVAARFNGGGHACAAGLNLKDVPLEQFRTQLVAALAAQLAAADAAQPVPSP